MESIETKPTFRGKFIPLPTDAAARMGSRFLDEDACRIYFLRWLHGSLAYCPKCGLWLRGSHAHRFWAGDKVRCPECRKAFSARTGTIMAGSPVTFAGAFTLALFIGLGMDDQEITLWLGCSRDMVRGWRERFRQVGEGAAA